MKITEDLEIHFEKFKKDEYYFNYFREWALEYLNTDPEYVKFIMNQLVKICSEKGYESAYSWCILYIGWVEYVNGNINNAIALHKKSLELFEKVNDNRGYVSVYNALLVDYMNLGYLELSIENGLKGIELCERINNLNATVALMINTAAVYVEYENYEEALAMINRAKLYKYEYRADYDIEMNIIRAQCFARTGKHTEAENCCKNAFNLVKEHKFVQWENKVLLILGENYSIAGDYKKARGYYERALNISENYNNIYMQGRVLLAWAICEFKSGCYDKSENIFLDAAELIKDREYILMKEKVYYYLSCLYEKCDNYKNAYKYLKISLDCKKILKNDSEMALKKLKEKDMAHAVEKYKSLYDNVERISDLGKSITSNLDIEKCTDTIYEVIEKLVPVDSFAIGMYDKDKNELNYKAVFKDGRRVDGFKNKIEDGKSLGAYCLCRKSNILISNMKKEYSKYMFKAKLDEEMFEKEGKSIVFIPLVIEDEPVGVMTVQSNAINAYRVSDINELKILASYIAIAIKNFQLFNEVKHFAEYDMLTECFNRNKILTIGNNIFDSNVKTDKKMSVAMIDIDNFKSINDKYGHDAGDIILKGTAQIIKSNLGNDAYIGRYGGEEFLVIFNKTNINEVLEICMQIGKLIEEALYNIGEKIISTTVSMGLYEYMDDISFYDGIKNADKRLYIAKENGKNKVICSG